MQSGCMISIIKLRYRYDPSRQTAPSAPVRLILNMRYQVFRDQVVACFLCGVLQREMA